MILVRGSEGSIYTYPIVALKIEVTPSIVKFIHKEAMIDIQPYINIKVHYDSKKEYYLRLNSHWIYDSREKCPKNELIPFTIDEMSELSIDIMRLIVKSTERTEENLVVKPFVFIDIEEQELHITKADGSELKFKNDHNLSKKVRPTAPVSEWDKLAEEFVQFKGMITNCYRNREVLKRLYDETKVTSN